MESGIEEYSGEKKVRDPRWKSPVLWQLCHGGWVVNTQTWSPLCIQSQHHINRETGTAMYRVSGKHSTKGMMETMLFAAVLKLRWVSLGKSVKSTCKPQNSGSRILLGVIFRQSYKPAKNKGKVGKECDCQNKSLPERLTISNYLCYENGGREFCFASFQNSA